MIAKHPMLLTLPTTKKHWSTNALWIAGGLVMVQMLVVGAFALRRALPSAPEPQAAVVAHAPGQPAPVAVAATPSTPGAAAQAPTPVAGKAGAPTVAKVSRPHHRAASGHKLVATRGGGKSQRNDDAIDDLLRKFK